MKEFQALILCGGLGTRLRAVLPEHLPKSLAPVNGTPFLVLLIRYLRRIGFRNVVLATGYKHDSIKEAIVQSRLESMTVTFSQEQEALGTAGAVKRAEPLLEKIFFVLNGDTFFEFGPERMLALLADQSLDSVIALARVEDAGRYGIVELDTQSRIIRFGEKSEKGPGFINGGVYVCRKEFAARIPAGRCISLEKEIFPQCAARRTIGGVGFEGRFIDIGIPEEYHRAHALLADLA